MLLQQGQDEEIRLWKGQPFIFCFVSLMGSSCSVLIESGRLKLGTWQGVYFCEFDGPRNRKVYVNIFDSAANSHIAAK
jgi:hypothetical protein